MQLEWIVVIALANLLQFAILIDKTKVGLRPIFHACCITLTMLLQIFAIGMMISKDAIQTLIICIFYGIIGFGVSLAMTKSAKSGLYKG